MISRPTCTMNGSKRGICYFVFDLLNIVCLFCYLWVGSISCTCDYEYLYIDRHFFWEGGHGDGVGGILFIGFGVGALERFLKVIPPFDILVLDGLGLGWEGVQKRSGSDGCYSPH